MTLLFCHLKKKVVDVFSTNIWHLNMFGILFFSLICSVSLSYLFIPMICFICSFHLFYCSCAVHTSCRLHTNLRQIFIPICPRRRIVSNYWTRFFHLPQYCFSVYYLIEMAPTDSWLLSASVTYVLDWCIERTRILTLNFDSNITLQ